jgi:transcriptional regulator with XRE-family HTH domain
MGFKENLKAELIFSGTLVKELAARSGIKKHTIDNYLNTHNSMPLADAAVKIAQVLGVSVEYLVTGQENHHEKALAPVEVRMITQITEQLNAHNRKTALALIQALKKLEDEQRQE